MGVNMKPIFSLTPIWFDRGRDFVDDGGDDGMGKKNRVSKFVGKK